MDRLNIADTESLPPDSGLMLVGHGTRDERGTVEFFRLAGLLRRVIHPIPLAECLLEFQEPTIAQAWKSLSGQGLRHVRVVPLLLFAAGHAKQDIPTAVAEAARSMPGPTVTSDQCRPISRQAALVELVDDRLRQTLAKIGSADINSSNHPIAVIMVGRGSYDPCAKADMRVLTEVVSYRHPPVRFETAFYAMAEPKLPQVIDRVAVTGRFGTIVVQPHLLFMGRLYEAIEGQVEQARSRYPEIDFIVGDYLGPVDAVARAIANRAGVVSVSEPL